MLENYSKLDKGIIYTTGAIFLDIIVGHAFTGRPLHESTGIKFPEYLQRAEEVSFAAGWFYTLIKTYRSTKDR